MAITAEMRAQVMELYSAYFNRVIDKAGVDYWLNDMDVNGLNIIQISNAFANSDEYKAIYSGLTNEQIVAKVYQNVLNRDGDAAGVAYWTGELNSGAIAVENLVLAVITAAKEDKDELGDAMVLANKTAVNNYAFTNNNNDKTISLSTITNDPASVATVTEQINAGNQGGGSTSGETKILTVAQDFITGTSSDDTFVAYVAQNMMGQQVNTLGSGDVINGGAGVDTLDAQITTGAWANGNTLGGLGMAVAPITNSVENIILHAEIADIATPNTDTVVVNAKYMSGVTKIASNYSDASLLVQNMTTKGVGTTSKMTVGMEYTGNADTNWDEANMAVYFDQDYLVRSSVEENSLYYFTQDRLTMNDSGKPFGANTTTVDGLNFTLNGVRKSVVIAQDKLDAFLAAVPADVTAAYQAFTALLVEALNIAKLTDSSLADLQISLDTSFVRTHGGIKNNGDPLKAPVPAIALTGSENDVLSSPKMHQNDSNLGSYDMFNDIDDSKAVANTPVAINVDLEKVGLAADGGALVIGSMNKDGTNTFGNKQGITVTDTVAGFDEFYVHVAGSKAKNSSLASLHSTDNTLRKVTIDSKGGDANLVIGNANTEDGAGPGFGALANSADNAKAFKDVQVMDASKFAGKLTLNAGITKDIADKYLNNTQNVLLNGLNNVKTELAAFDYKGGAGNDVINMFIDNTALQTATANSIFKSVAGTVNQNVFQMNINGGAGNDTITVKLDANFATAANKDSITNITINGGAGNDTIDITSGTTATFVVAFDGSHFGHDKIIGFNGGAVALTNEVQTINLAGFAAHKGEIIKVSIGGVSTTFTATGTMTETQIAAQVVAMLEAPVAPTAPSATQLFDNGSVANVAAVVNAAAAGKNVNTFTVEVISSVEAAGTYDKFYDTKHKLSSTTTEQGGLWHSNIANEGADVLDFTAYGAKGVVVGTVAAGTGIVTSVAGQTTFTNTVELDKAGAKFIFLEASAHNADVYNVYLATTLTTGVGTAGANAIDFLSEDAIPANAANTSITAIGSIDLGATAWGAVVASQFLI